MHQKILRVQQLNEELGAEGAKVLLQTEDIARAEHWEAFFRQELLGRKSNYQPE